MTFRLRAPALLALVGLMALAAACTPVVQPSGSPTPIAGTIDSCPTQLQQAQYCYTPYGLRVSYGAEPLIREGYTGKGVTIVDIVSFGSPTLQQDMDTFDQQFGLPPITIKVVSPLGTVPFNPAAANMVGWATETELDVQLIHAVAPEANIVVMTSPVDETEGTIGLPQFMQLEQYAVSHHLGQIFSQSWAASEATLADSTGQQFRQGYTAFLQSATQQGYTFLAGSGDNGATDCAVIDCVDAQDQPIPAALSTTPVVNFPGDEPYVTAVGGTSLQIGGGTTTEVAWPDSGGGVSKLYSEPSFQHGLPAAVQTELNGYRGVPDVAADADPQTGMAFYFSGQWLQVGGTSAATPTWAAVIAIADQMAGHGLGNINPGLYKLGTSASAGQDFRDITSGSNSQMVEGTPVQGFTAEPGWDAVTGWGAPQAQHLVPDLIAALK